MAYLRGEVANVLGRTDLPEQTRGFADMGMDSLMGLTFTNRLETNLEVALPATLALEYPTIERLADYLANEILLLPAQSQQKQDQATDIYTKQVKFDTQGEPSLQARAAQLESLSEEEAEALLLATLAGM
jgi:acyl carrier protein